MAGRARLHPEAYKEVAQFNGEKRRGTTVRARGRRPSGSVDVGGGRRLPPQERVLGPPQDRRRHLTVHADRRRAKVRRQHHQGLRPAPTSETNQLQDQVVQGGNMATAFWRKDVKAWGIGYKIASGKW